MISSFCPGHVSCVFQPVMSYDAMSTGSRGFGIRLSIGSLAKVSERDDGVVSVRIDGEEDDAPVVRKAVSVLAPDRGFDIVIENDLPVSQGFGMSASGTIAATLCVAEIVGEPRTKAFSVSHAAEVLEGGGLGDVSAIVAGRDVPIRTVAGFPPFGTVRNAGFSIPSLTLAVLGPKTETGAVLRDRDKMSLIREISTGIIDGFVADPTYHNLFSLSNRFSSESGLESEVVGKTIRLLQSKGYNAGMCMLGNSIFTDAPKEILRSLLGRGHVKAFVCSSSSKEIIVRRG